MMDLHKVPLNEWGHVTYGGRDCMLLAFYMSPHLPIKQVAYLWRDKSGCCFPDHAAITSSYFAPVPRKVKVSGWLNVYANGCMDIARSQCDAANMAGVHYVTKRIACVPINLEVTEGEGL